MRDHCTLASCAGRGALVAVVLASVAAAPADRLERFEALRGRSRGRDGRSDVGRGAIPSSTRW